MSASNDFADFRAALGETFSREDAERLFRWECHRRGRTVKGAEIVPSCKPSMERPSIIAIRVVSDTTEWNPLTPQAFPPSYRSIIEVFALRGLPQAMSETLKAFFGFADWRLVLLLVAQHRDEQGLRMELAAWIAKAREVGNSDELRAMARCMDAVEGLEKMNRAKALAIYFVIQRQLKYGKLPTKSETRRYVESAGVRLGESKNLARDLFKGPILGTLPRGRAGRPRGSRSVQKNNPRSPSKG